MVDVLDDETFLGLDDGEVVDEINIQFLPFIYLISFISLFFNSHVK